MKKIKFRLYLVFISVVFAPAVIADSWHEYRSDNFTVYSDVSESKVTVLLKDLERFRRAALIFTGLPDTEENRKLRIFYFNSAAEFNKFSGSRRIAGFFKDTWEGPIIFSKKGGLGDDNAGLLFHEYVHHLMRDRSAIAYPQWYSEGFAELLASAELRDEAVLIGGIPKWRVNAWRSSADQPLDLSELMHPNYKRNSVDYWNNYYATSWLFTHYLQLGRLAGRPDYLSASVAYFQEVARGADPEEIFEKHFGKSLDDIQKDLRLYTRKSIYSYHFDIAKYENSISRRKIGRNEQLNILSRKAQHLGNEALAMEYLLESKKDQPGWQENQLEIAVLKGHQKDFEYGERVLAGLSDSMQKTPLTAAELSHFYGDRLHALQEQGEWNEADFQAALNYANQAIELDPKYLPGYRYLWVTYQYKGENNLALRAMLAAYKQEPNDYFLNTEIGFYLAASGRLQDARNFLTRVISWTHDEEIRAKAEKFLELADAEIEESKNGSVADQGASNKG